MYYRDMENNKTNLDSHLANYTPNDPTCPICKKAVEPQHSMYCDPVTATFAHDYCFRTETQQDREGRRKEAVKNGAAAVYGPLRWA